MQKCMQIICKSHRGNHISIVCFCKTNIFCFVAGGFIHLVPLFRRRELNIGAHRAALWDICLAIYKVAHAAYFISGWCTALHTGLTSAWSWTSCINLLNQREFAWNKCLIPKANWIYLKIQGQLVINCYPKKAHCTPATTVDISTGRDGEPAKLRFRMLATVPHWRREFSLGLRGGNWITASPVFS